MTDELRSALRVDGAEPPPPDLTDVARRRRRLAVRRSLITAGVSALVVASLVVGATLWPEKKVPNQIAGTIRSVSSPTERALTFAVRAVEQAGLIDWTGTAYEFERIDDAGAGWEVTFRHYECPPDGAAGCEFADPPLILRVAVHDERLGVVDVDGEIEAEQDASLRRYEEGTNPERIGFELLSPIIVPTEEGRQRLVTSWLWSGPLPSPGYGAICRPFLLNGDLERVGRMRRQYAFASPGSTPNEQQRTGGLWLSPVPQGVEGAALVDDGCRVVKVKGWRPDGPATFSGFDGESSMIEVPLRWDGPIAPIVTTCVVAALDRDGNELATDTHNVDSYAWTKVSSTRGRSRSEFLKIDADLSDARDIEVTCRPWRPPGSG